MMRTPAGVPLWLLCVALSVLAGWYGRALQPVGWALFLAPMPILWYARRVSWRAAASAAFVAWLMAGLGWWSYLRPLMTLPLTVLAMAGPALVFTGGVLLWRWARGWRGALLLPCYWVTYEYVNMLTSPHSSAGSLVYHLMDYLPLMQIASLTGLWGVLFVLFLVPAAIDSRRHFAAACAVLAAVLIYGGARLYNAPDGQPVRVTVLPERIPDNPPPAQFRDQARRTQTDVVAGLVTRDAAGERNSALLFPADGGSPVVYHKHHLIPGLESRFTPGTELVTVERPSGRWGLLVCKDMDFPALSRAYAQRGIALALVPAWDFTVDAWLHSRMAILRGIENGFSIARNAREGLVTNTDAYGREGELRVAPVRTLYTQAGDWFAWLCVVGLLLLVATPAYTRRG